MSADSERRRKAWPVLAAALFLLLGAGGGYAFAFASTEQTQHVMWPVSAVIAAAGIFVFMRFRRGRAPTIAAGGTCVARAQGGTASARTSDGGSARTHGQGRD